MVDVYPFLTVSAAGVWRPLARSIEGSAWADDQVFESFIRAEVEAAKQLCESMQYTAGAHGIPPSHADPQNGWNFRRMNDPESSFWQEDDNPYHTRFKMGRITLHS